jgi:hypothetical protein
MSFEDTNCPCGGKKPVGTMLCADCESAFAIHPAMVAFKDKTAGTEFRRHAAYTLISLAKNRDGKFARKVMA